MHLHFGVARVGGRRGAARTGGSLIARLLGALLCLGLLPGGACTPSDNALLLPASHSDRDDPPGARLVVRIVHVTDTQIVDSQSPGRYPGADAVVPTAWRAWENCSTQILDGIIRGANRLHASGRQVDFLLHTGDACDNVQANELQWFARIMDGQAVQPLSGPDDRAPDSLPPAMLDPYAVFQAQGLYRCGVHGPLASIPWYAMLGNHDAFAIGNFPIITTHDGTRVAPLPLSGRPGLLIPTVLDPTGDLAYGPVSPASPGPPPLLDPPTHVEPNADRHFFAPEEFVSAMFETATGPSGHGFSSPDGPRWYSVAAAPGLRLIGLDTSDVPCAITGLPYSEGSIGQEQLLFLQSELDAAQSRGELVIVASHHPSRTLEVLYGSAVGPDALRGLLNQYPNVILHLAGHTHINRVADRGGYLEIETCAIADPPMEARVVEIWQDGEDGSIVIHYRMFDGLDESMPALGDDPLRLLRAQAYALAKNDHSAATVQRGAEGNEPNAAGDPADREGEWRKSR